MKDVWLQEQCRAAFEEANRILHLWEIAPKKNKKKLWFAFQMAEERQKMMMTAAINVDREGRA